MGLVVATSDGEIVGWAHAGFGPNAEQTGLDRQTGVVCAVLVRPDHRRNGVGRRLVACAEKYLRDAGAAEVFAGGGPVRDPFYLGLYGGSEPAGFLESDPDAAPFVEAIGYQPAERHAVFQRSITDAAFPINMQLMNARRKTELVVAADPDNAPWWWLTRFGRLDSVQFALALKADARVVASACVVGLDLYVTKWHQRAIGLCGLSVAEEHGEQGYEQCLIAEICRRLRDELVSTIEAHAPETGEQAKQLLNTTGFEQVDAGVVYRRVD